MAKKRKKKPGKTVKKTSKKAARKPAADKPKKKAKKPARKNVKKAPPAKTTWVRSNAYDEHERAARGTYTPITINSTFQKNADNTAIGNAIGQLFKKTFDPHRKDMPDGTMWHRLLATIRPDLKYIRGFQFHSLHNFEFDDKHRLHTLFDTQCTNKLTDLHSGQIIFDVSLRRKFDTKRERVDEYRITMITAFFSLGQPHTSSETLTGPMKGHVNFDLSFKCVIPLDTTVIVVALKGEYMSGEIQAKQRFGMKVLTVVDLQPAKLLTEKVRLNFDE